MKRVSEIVRVVLVGLFVVLFGGCDDEPVKSTTDKEKPVSVIKVAASSEKPYSKKFEEASEHAAEQHIKDASKDQVTPAEWKKFNQGAIQGLEVSKILARLEKIEPVVAGLQQDVGKWVQRDELKDDLDPVRRRALHAEQRADFALGFAVIACAMLLFYFLFGPKRSAVAVDKGNATLAQQIGKEIAEAILANHKNAKAPEAASSPAPLPLKPIMVIFTSAGHGGEDVARQAVKDVLGKTNLSKELIDRSESLHFTLALPDKATSPDLKKWILNHLEKLVKDAAGAPIYTVWGEALAKIGAMRVSAVSLEDQEVRDFMVIGIKDGKATPFRHIVGGEPATAPDFYPSKPEAQAKAA